MLFYDNHLSIIKGGDKVKKKDTIKAQMLIFTLIFTLAIMGAASAADNSSNNLTAQASSTIVSNDTTNSNNSAQVQVDVQNQTGTDPQIEHNGVINPTIYPNIRAAVTAAQSGDTIWLENGATFTGTENTQITISKNLIFNVFGGGTATIDGLGTNWGFEVNSGNTVSFNNIIFQNTYRSNDGAAIRNLGGTVTLNNCIVRNSVSTGTYVGGGIYNGNGGIFTLNNCQIYGNTASSGAGIYSSNIVGTTLIISNSIIRDNNGQGIRVNGGSGQISGNQIYGNTQGINIGGGSPNITGNTITGNYLQGIYVISATPSITGNNINNNGHAPQQGDGIWVDSGNPIITSNNIRNNAEDGIHVNGPSNTQATSIQIHYNSIVDNGEWGLHVMNGVWVNASNNWWGSNAPVYTRSTTAPSSPSDIFEERSGTQHVTYNPWLFLRISTNTPIYNGETSTVTADLTHDYNNNISPGTVPDGTLVTFALINGPYGSLTTPLSRSTTAGQANIIFTANDPNAPHIQNVNAIVDHQIVTSGIVINPKANVYMTKTGNGPLNVGQTGTFTITLTNNGPNAATNVQVTDPVPTGFTAGTPSTGTYVGNVWTIPSLANGATATLTFNRVMTNADAGTTKTNTASETQDTYNPTPITDKTATINVNQAATVVMTKTGNGPLNVGQTGTFTITLTNNGPNAATNVQVTDPVPTGFTAGTPSTGTYVGNVWTIPSLANGATATLTFNRVMTNADAGTTKTNTASETQDTYNPTPITDKTATINVNQAATVVMTKTGNGPLNVGQTGTFTITLTNNGPNAATNVQVTDPVPTGFTAGTPSTGTYVGNVWTIPSLANGATATLTFNRVMTNADAGTTKTNTASETQDTYNPTPITDKTATINVNQAATVVMTKTGNGPLNVGQTGTFTITLTNNGPNAATNVQVTDPVPTGFTAGTPSTGTYVGNVWTIPSLANGATATLTFNRVMTNADAGTTKTNTASETQDTYNPTPITDKTATINVNQAATVVMTKTGNGPLNVGQTGTFTITLTNNGPNAATNVQVTDPVPTGFTAGTPSTGTYVGNVWTIPSLANGATATLTFNRVMTNADAGTTKTNTASETQDTYNPTPITDKTATINVNQAATVVMTKTGNGPLNVGQTGTFTITLTNNGPNAATNVQVTDPVPTGFTAGTPSTGTYVGNVWTIPSLANGATATLTFNRVMTNADAGTTKTNTASETQDTYNPTPITDKTATINVNNAALTITKTANQANYNVGNNVDYTIQVTNSGPNTATNVVVTDTLPAGLTYLSSTMGGVYDSATRTVTWTIASLDNGVHFLAAVSAIVTSDAAGKTVTNTLQAKDDQMVDPVSTSASIYVPSAALELTKTVNNSTPKVNDTVLYTLIVQNHGPDAAASVKVTDVVPTGGLKFVGVDSVIYGTYDPNTGVWTIGDLPANSVAKLVLRFTVTRSGTIENNAKVTSLTYDPNLYPTEASVTINVQKPEPVNPIPTVGAKTIAMQHTGLPIGALILAVIMLFTGIVLPKRKN